MRIIVLIIALVIFSCAPSSEGPNTEIATQMFAAFNAHDWQKMTSFYSANAEYLDPAYGKEYVKKSAAEIAEKYAGMQQMFPDIHDEVKNMHVAGDKIIVEFISTGSSGDSLNFSLRICSVLTFQNGKIVRDATYYDNQ